MAKLQQVALAHGLKQLNAGDGGAATAVVGLEPAHIAVGQAAAEHRAHDLAAVVGALVTHHLVTRGAVLVGVRKVTVKAALELALTGGFLVLRGRNIGQHIVNLMTIHVDDGIHVIGSLHAALELERCGAGVIQTANKLRSVGVARAQRALATGGGERAAVLVDQLVGQAAGLGAHAAVGRAARHGKARQQAQTRVAKADGTVAKDLEVDIGRGVVDGGDLVDGELAREGHAVGALLAAPDGSAVVMDVRLGRDMRLDAGHRALDLKEQTPVLDDEGIGAQRGAAMDELQRIGHLGLLDDDVDRDVDARAGQVRSAAGLLKGLVGKVRCLAAGVEAAHATVDGVCPGSECGGEGLRASGGGQELGSTVGGSTGGCGHILPFKMLR